jgi:hypothetical protein
LADGAFRISDDRTKPVIQTYPHQALEGRRSRAALLVSLLAQKDGRAVERARYMSLDMIAP